MKSLWICVGKLCTRTSETRGLWVLAPGDGGEVESDEGTVNVRYCSYDFCHDDHVLYMGHLSCRTGYCGPFPLHF